MGAMSKYKAAFSVGLASSMEYRFNFFMNLLSTAFPIILQVFLWMAMYGGSGSGVMYGYTFPQMILYVVVAGAISKFTSTGIEYVVNDDIHTGGIAKFLCKPVSYIFFRLAGVVGQKISSMAVMALLIVASLLALKYIVGFQIGWASALLFVPSLFLAAVLNFCLFFCVSTLAFWLTEIGSFFHALGVVIMVLSGGVFPIDIFGAGFVAVARYLPMTYTVNYPIRILAGIASVADALGVLCIQAVWIAALLLLAHLLWKTGIRKYVAVGG